MASPRVKSSTIKQETFLQALIVNQKNIYSTTPQLRNIVQAPDGYDCGAKLFGMEKSLLLEKKSNGGSNVYRATAAGKQRLLKRAHLVQPFGQYTVVLTGEIEQPQMILGATYSSVADQAMSELAGIIEKNSRLKSTIAGMVTQINMALGDI
jgi:hypothetical protein